MSVILAENELPQELTADQAVEAAYTKELAEVASKLQRGLPALLECDKDLAPYLYLNIRNRLRAVNLRCLYLDGRPRAEDQQGPVPMGMMGTMIAQLREAVRGPVERRVVVLPHLDLLTTSQGGLTAEAREVIPLLYENPELVWVGFKDPSFPLPRVIENLFPHRVSLLGVSRNRLRCLITRKEARKFGRDLNPWGLYKYVSGINAVRLRKLLSTLEGEDYPANPANAYRQLRQATLGGTLEVPNISMDKDIGGYTDVKKRLRSEVLDLLARKDQLTSEEQIRGLEELIPKGMIFWGPPGTGKTLFAKAMASEIGAAITVVSGPELKSKWVGESEDNLRQIFHRARQSAPSIIVFDELDSFASARGTYTGSGVEHSMVNQLLTEMDGFHREEMVFVVGTTNFVEILDPALLRPGRFEFHLKIPYPDDAARREIIKIYDKKMGLNMPPETVEYALKRTDYHVPGAARGTFFSGDHLNALCRAIARFRLREGRQDATTPDDVERALTEWVDKQILKPSERWVVATHEAGHAIVALVLGRPVHRIALVDNVVGALGYVRHSDHPNQRQVQSREEMLDDICICLAAGVAEQEMLGTSYNGAAQDLLDATGLARDMVEALGLGGERCATMRYRDWDGKRLADLSEDTRKALDQAAEDLINAQRQRAADIIKQFRPAVDKIRRKLDEDQLIEGKSLPEVLEAEWWEKIVNAQEQHLRSLPARPAAAVVKAVKEPPGEADGRKVKTRAAPQP
jgi:cell division protease FtsH